VKLHAHFVAESANFASDGTFTVFKGGIDQMASARWPALTRLAIITRLELDAEESRRLVEMQVRVLFQGVQMGASTQPLAVKAAPVGGRSYVNSIANLNLGIPGPGVITIAATVNDEALPLLYLTVTQTGA
jgi:hypothetical protein